MVKHQKGHQISIRTQIEAFILKKVPLKAYWINVIVSLHTRCHL